MLYIAICLHWCVKDTNALLDYYVYTGACVLSSGEQT